MEREFGILDPEIQSPQHILLLNDGLSLIFSGLYHCANFIPVRVLELSLNARHMGTI